MKGFLLLLLIYISFLFGQDVLTLKNGESFEGTFYGKIGENIVFKVEGETSTTKYSINDVNIIVTKNGKLTYPFDILTEDDIQIEIEKPRFEQDVLLHKSGKSYKGRYIANENDVIIFRLEGQKDIKMFLINDVDIIVANRGGTRVVLYYPFDIYNIHNYPKRGFSRNITYGFFSYRMPYSFFDYSFINNINDHSELYGSLSLLMPGISIGYKHYFKGSLPKPKHFGFVSANISFGSFYAPDAAAPTHRSISIAGGGSVWRNKKSESSILNIGLMISYSRWINNCYYKKGERICADGVIEFIPIINLEKEL